MKRALKTVTAAYNLLRLGVGRPGDYIKNIGNKLEEIVDKVNQYQGIYELRQILQNVEIYQPVYGLEGILDSENISRPNTRERAETIESQMGTVNNVKILDLGSSLGYISLYFAERGAVVEGWDYNELNILASNKIKSIVNPNMQAFFSSQSS